MCHIVVICPSLVSCEVQVLLYVTSVYLLKDEHFQRLKFIDEEYC